MKKQSIVHLAVTMGDPAGIGPEIILQGLRDPQLTANCQITIIGSLAVLEETYQKLSKTKPLADPQNLSVWDIPNKKPIKPGVGTPDTGAACFSYLETAIKATLEGKFSGIVTAPIAKSLWQAAGYNYPGQTEVLATYAQVSKYGMLFVGKSPHTDWVLRTLLATTHIPLEEVPRQLNPQLMSLKLELLIETLQSDFGITQPKIAIAGLNPHSGEEGKLGKEEIEWLIPWVKAKQAEYSNLQLIGPIPPDTMWVNPGQAWYQSPEGINTADAYLALYHDQGLIPVKLMAFNEAVNTTIGLPFVRTSPDHGTAFDIAGLGKANPSSMKSAIQWAIALTLQRQLTA